MIRKLLIAVVLLPLLIPSLVLADGDSSPLSVQAFAKGKDHRPGFMDVYYDPASGELFLQIDNLNQPFIFQSSMPRGVGSNDIGLDRGELGNTRLVQFERYGNKVLLKQINTAYRAQSNNAAEQASVKEAFAQSVIAGFEVVAVDGDGVIVKYTEFLLSDVDRLARDFKNKEQGEFKVDATRSAVYPDSTKSFPDNTELEALVTFAGSEPGEYVQQVTPDANSVSVHLHHSLIRLPEHGYQTRVFHPYSGFWKVSYQDYSAPITESMEVRSIPRHRLRKKEPLAQTSEAVEPIIYYLDPGVPEPVLSALRDGALWWNQAFEQIGYKNAFQVKILPEGADPMDVRYNVIQWVHRATRGWSYGSSVRDPRTGEIIKGHVTLGSLRVRQDYLIATGLTSPFTANAAADNTNAQKQMALARIRQLSAHEVGHTIGLAHNFAASANARASVMDYPHPNVQLSDGKITLDKAYGVGLGAWDHHAVAYGYQDYTNREAEQKGLAEIIAKGRANGLSYQSDPDARSALSANAEGHLWDGGEDPVQELIRLSKVRALALENFGINSIPKGTPLASLEETLVPIYLLHRYQLDAAVKLLGGVRYEYELKGDYPAPKGVKAVAGDRQREAMAAMINTLSPDFLHIPESITQLIPPKAYGDARTRESFTGRTGLTFDPLSAAESAAAYSLSLILNTHRLNRMNLQNAGTSELPGVTELVNEVFKATLLKLSSDTGGLQSRVNYLVVNQLMNATVDPELAPEVRAELLQALKAMGKRLGKKSRSIHDQEIARLLDVYWKTGQWHGQVEVRPMPPGSPI
ncbi:MAG: zinc-dependent metalloprotease [Pseudomonadales bacterium]